MSTSLLDHAFGIRGYDYARTDYQGGEVIFTISQDPGDWRGASCGAREVISRGHVERRFRSLPIGCRATTVVLPIPRRLECTQCRPVPQAEVLFAEPRRSFTSSFERYVLELSRSMTILDVAHHLGVGWDTIKDIQKRRPVAAIRQAQAQARAGHRHRRDRRGQGASLPHGGHGPGERRSGLRRRRQGGRRLKPFWKAAAAQRA